MFKNVLDNPRLNEAFLGLTDFIKTLHCATYFANIIFCVRFPISIWLFCLVSQHWFVLFVLDGGWSNESFLRKKKMCFLSSKTRCQCSGSFKDSLRLLSTCNWSLWWRLISSQRHKMAYCGLERTLVGRPFRSTCIYVKNSNGLMTFSWGSPDASDPVDEVFPSTITTFNPSGNLQSNCLSGFVDRYDGARGTTLYIHE